MQKIDFQIDTEYGQYCDAINLEDGETMTDDEIEAEKQRRLANWLVHFELPPASDQPQE
jgi:hypothetical protein